MAEIDMRMIEHLQELRKRLMITFITFIVAFAAAFLYVKDLYRLLAKDVPQQLAILGPSDVIWVYIMIAGVFAIAATIPVASYQTWRFVQPALTPVEQRAALAYIPALSILFIVGLAFGYFVIFPMVLQFLNEMAEDNFLTFYTAEKYFRFMLHMTVPFGILFEMPAVVMFLTKIGILNPLKLSRMRKMAYFLLVIIAVTITPPDIVSDILVIVPLFILYEISITLSKWVYRKQLKTDSDEAASYF
ncbi:twin-arginine translocase subunit TatC [Marinicrinis lubricantis]|uniref:Sec-independent protein translocase protein TatC n=1 Tax=Marinicrinis lubricantis TaxID=2086470 RepID=A0ABW1IJJ2_9BACL